MTEMDLCVARAGPFHLAVAASQLAGVAPCPAYLAWPPSPEGFMGLAPAGAGRDVAVIDPLTCWQAGAPQGDAATPDSSGGRERPGYVLVLAGGVLALAVDAYALTPCPVQPAPAVLASRGIHALTPTEHGYAVVLDMARVAGAAGPPVGIGTQS